MCCWDMFQDAFQAVFHAGHTDRRRRLKPPLPCTSCTMPPSPAAALAHICACAVCAGPGQRTSRRSTWGSDAGSDVFRAAAGVFGREGRKGREGKRRGHAM